MADTQPAMTYPTEGQYQRWKTRAAEMDISVSEFMQAMVEAGMKKFDADAVEPDESARELRRQRNDLRDEFQATRERIEKLERDLYRGERRTIIEYVHENPGTTYGELQQHIINTVPSRVNRLLDTLEGEEVRADDGAYYPVDDGGRSG
ncbi:hypothetical protein [Natronobiforma cellulositropha]|uniref:hypothetical protein n=1 Tax=Natronobiforma cellulositropha TaxID=1679076 RepID=UPI0021D5E42D|nr:hypothetical protein [Natronobiforma cellulositropha]